MSGSDTDTTSSSGDTISDAMAEPSYAEPYQFEPDASSSDSEEEEEDVEMEINDRMANSDWCQCGNCQIMDLPRECVCCKEIQAVKNTLTDVPEGYGVPTCITQHPGFAAVCTNKYVLKTAWYQYRQQYEDPGNGPEHKLNRHIAYRQLARWCWGFLGRHVRVVLPSCAVLCIRAHFPPPGLEEDFVFEGFKYADE